MYTYTYIHTQPFKIRTFDQSIDRNGSLRGCEREDSHVSIFQRHDGGFCSATMDEDDVLVAGMYLCMPVCMYVIMCNIHRHDGGFCSATMNEDDVLVAGMYFCM